MTPWRTARRLGTAGPAALALLLACDTRTAAPTSASAPPAPPETVANPPTEVPEERSDLDGDGIEDAVDACPGIPEDLDRFADEDGCPDRDNDGDGRLDAAAYVDGAWINCDGGWEYNYWTYKQRGLEKVTPWIDCRDNPESYNGEDDEDGCPEINQIICYQFNLPGPLPLAWSDGRLTLPPASRTQLADVVSIMVASPPLQVKISAHTDERSNKARARTQTQALAEALADEIAAMHPELERSRLIAGGFGDEHPIAVNTTPEGRRANLRVELDAVFPEEEASRTHILGVCVFGTPAQQRACGCDQEAAASGRDARARRSSTQPQS